MIFSRPGRKHPAKHHPAATTPQSDSTHLLQHPQQAQWRTQSAVNLSRPSFEPCPPVPRRPSGPENNSRRRNLPRSKTASTPDVSTHSPKLPPRGKPAKIEQGRVPIQAPASSLQAKSRSNVRWQDESTETSAQGALCALISSKFDAVITSIDGETFGGDAKDLGVYPAREERRRTPVAHELQWYTKVHSQEYEADGVPAAERPLEVQTVPYRQPSSIQTTSPKPISTQIQGCRPISRPCDCKISRSSIINGVADRFPLSYLASYPLLCLAAQYSQRAYTKPAGKEREAFVNANWHMGTKAMVIKSVPIDDINCVVFAIRGSQTFLDWAVNLNSEPVPPTDFLVNPDYLGIAPQS